MEDVPAKWQHLFAHKSETLRTIKTAMRWCARCARSHRYIALSVHLHPLLFITDCELTNLAVVVPYVRDSADACMRFVGHFAPSIAWTLLEALESGDSFQMVCFTN